MTVGVRLVMPRRHIRPSFPYLLRHPGRGPCRGAQPPQKLSRFPLHDASERIITKYLLRTPQDDFLVPWY